MFHSMDNNGEDERRLRYVTYDMADEVISDLSAGI